MMYVCHSTPFDRNDATSCLVVESSTWSLQYVHCWLAACCTCGISFPKETLSWFSRRQCGRSALPVTGLQLFRSLCDALVVVFCCPCRCCCGCPKVSEAWPRHGHEVSGVLHTINGTHRLQAKCWARSNFDDPHRNHMAHSSTIARCTCALARNDGASPMGGSTCMESCNLASADSEDCM